MSNAQHTQGPWVIQQSGGSTEIIATSPIMRIAELWLNQDTRANAALIASAPDLLAERDRLKTINEALNASLVEAQRVNAEMLALLIDLDERFTECAEIQLTAAEAYDSFYRETVSEVIAAARSQS